MPHFLSYIAGRGAKEIVKSISENCGLDQGTSSFLGTAAQLGVGLTVGILTLDVGGKIATMTDVANQNP